MKQLLFLAVIAFALTSTAFAIISIDLTPYWQNQLSADKYHTGLQWHDLNRDGYPDLYLSNGNDMNLARNFIFVNDNGNLPTYPSWQCGNYEYSGHCAVGDLNYDGYPEMLVSNFLGSGGFSYPNRQQAYLNNSGTMDFWPYWNSVDSTWSFSCALGDLDGDGDLDAVFACGEGYSPHFVKQKAYFNNNGVFPSTATWQSWNDAAMIDVTLGDVDNDGDLDLAFCGDETPVTIYHNNNGVIDNFPSWESTDSESSNTLAFGDMDGDGWLDLAVADNNQLGGQGKFKVYRNVNGTLTSTPVWQSSTGGYGSSVSWCDLDYDGDLDLATGRWWSEVLVYENTGSTLTTTPAWVSSSAYESVIEEIQFADVDRDGVGYYKESLPAADGKKLHYLRKACLHSVDSVFVDGIKLDFSQYCYNLVDGWVSVGVTPSSLVKVYFQWSYKPDMGVSNWDLASYVFANNLTPDFLPGNADGEGTVDIDDVVFLIQYIFGGGAAPDPVRAGDANASGDVDIDDAVHLLNYIFVGGIQLYYP